MPDTVQHAQPPPNIQPRLLMHRSELVGMAIIAILPLLAIFNVFGPRHEQASAVSEALQLDLSYPSVLRHKALETIKVKVRNRSQRTIPEVAVTFDRAFMDGFSSLSFVPRPVRPFVVELRGLDPGETRLIIVELEAERYGRFRGAVAAKAGDRTLAVDTSAFIFP